MIRVEKAIRILEMFLHKQCDLERTKFAYDANEVWEAVKIATEHLKEQRWIPCSVDLPKKKDKKAKYGRGEYNGTVVNEDGHVFTTSVIFDYVNKKWVEEVTGWKVIAWKPLPEPYKGE